MQMIILAIILTLLPGVAAAQSTTYDLGSYKPVNEATVEQSGDLVSLTWEGEPNGQLLIKQAQPSALPGGCIIA